MAEILKRGRTYTIRVSAGYNLSGKHIRKNMTWTPDPGMTDKQIEKELSRQVAFFEEKVASGRVIDSNIKFASFAEKWMKDYAEKQLAAKTIHRYKHLMIRINSAIGHIRLDRLQPIHLISFYDNLGEKDIRGDLRYKSIKVNTEKESDQPITKLTSLVAKNPLKVPELAAQIGVSETTLYTACQGKVVSAKSAKAIAEGLKIKQSSIFTGVNKTSRLGARTILHHHRLISSILSTAVTWQVIFSNPAERVKPPKVIRTESKYLDEIQTKNLIEKLKEESIQNRTMITMLIFLGIRRGELCGLKWEDIDFDSKVIHIQRSLQYLPKRGTFEKLPKSTSSIRALKMSDIVVKLLSDYQNWQNDEKVS